LYKIFVTIQPMAASSVFILHNVRSATAIPGAASFTVTIKNSLREALRPLGAQGIEAESPQALHRQSRGLGAESPVFLRLGRKKMCHEDPKKVNDAALPFPLRALVFPGPMMIK
jgi:hypothetical protein